LHNETERLYQRIETDRFVFMEVEMSYRPFAAFLDRGRFLAILMLGAYALINLILVALAPITAGWPIWATTALAVPPMVLGMVYMVIPIARRKQSASG